MQARAAEVSRSWRGSWDCKFCARDRFWGPEAQSPGPLQRRVIPENCGDQPPRERSHRRQDRRIPATLMTRIEAEKRSDPQSRNRT